MAEEGQKAVLLSRRTTLLTSLGRAEEFVESYIEERDYPQVQIRVQHLDVTWVNLDNVQLQLEDIEETEAGIVENARIRADYETRLFQIKANLLSKIRISPEPTQSSLPPHVKSALSGIKLPTVKLPDFDGDYKQWLAFHDTFLALIHTNPDVPEIQKFHYLRAAVKGEAAQLIESIAISSVNYNIAWETLTGRYSNEYLLKKRHLQALFDTTPMKKETASALHALLDEFERHIKVLHQLKEPTDSWSTILEHLLCTRLHDDTLKAWEDHASTVDDPNYTCLVEFLHRRTRVLESISVNHHPASSNSSTAASTSKNLASVQVSCASTSRPGEKCAACKQSHFVGRCSQFAQAALAERQRIVESARLCHNCLGNHMVRNCTSKFNCRQCKRRHHTLLHSDQAGNDESTSDTSATSSTSNQTEQTTLTTTTVIAEEANLASADVVPGSVVSLAVHQAKENVFLLTAIIKVVDALGIEHLVRALLDSASQPNLITNRMANILRLRRRKAKFFIEGAGRLSQAVRYGVSTIIKSRTSDFSCEVDFLLMEKLTSDLPSHNISISDWNIPQNLVLADPSFNECQSIDMVLGAKHFLTFFPPSKHIKLGENLPLMVNSVFGWVVAGAAIEGTSERANETYSSNAMVSTITLDEVLERFWQTEELTIHDNYSVEERECEAFYKDTVTRTPEGRYVVRYPRKPGFANMLGDSKATALKRFELLERRLERDHALKEEYHKFMREFLTLDHMRLVEQGGEDDSMAYYLPHHPVMKESSTTTKVRVVFDASAATSTGFSLNQALRVGPVIQDDLLTLLLRLRTYPVALVADIAKMYRQVLIHPDDRKLQRIFWRFSPDSPVQIYELQTVTYGLAPSAFLATRTLKQLVIDEGGGYPLGRPALDKNFYVDDLIGGAQSLEEAIQLRKELSELLNKGGFELRKWTSNRLEVLQGLSKELIGTNSSVEFSPNEMIKALGIGWEPEADHLRYDSQVQSNDNPWTKQTILAAIARLFDPSGHVAPVVVTAKIIMQQLWLLSCDWHDPVPDSLRVRWDNFYKDLSDISSYRIERYAFLPNATVQLHIFADASEAAYGACCYARCVNAEGQVRIVLLAAKSRVAPLKRVPLPRLELNAGVLGVHLYSRIKPAIDIEIERTYFWSDSAVTLQWISAPPNVWKTYVANRVSEIQHYSHGCSWNHVPTKDNPADLVSRGMMVPEFLGSAIWKEGPHWLKEPPSQWPKSNLPRIPQDDLEVRTVTAITRTEATIHPWFLRWSSYTKLLHVVGYILRFINNVREKARTTKATREPSPRALTVEQVEHAKISLARLAQQDTFSNELKLLQSGKSIQKQSHVRKLSPFIDKERVMRVGGRLKLSQLLYQAKHPILLSGTHPFSKLIAEHYHRKLLHGGGRDMLSTIRMEFWPTDGRILTRGVVRRCFRCVRLNPQTVQQQIGQLPSLRVIPSPPFSTTGVDYAGPLYLKPIHKRAAAVKAYICIFVCFSTKAVHIELVGDLSTHAFLCALNRFVSRRNTPLHIFSDNGKNFEGASNMLAELYDLLRNQEAQETILEHCTEKGITWHFTPPKAPHFGGLWEAAVKVAKRHLFRQLGSTRLSFEDMCTVLTQIEAHMNSRPLLPLSEDPNDLAALTPAHFLTGSSLHALPDPDLRDIPANRLDHYQQLRAYTQKFWHHWRQEYLQEMQKDTKGYQRNDEIKKGRMVIMVDELQGPLRWPLARVEAVHPGEDKIVRVVSLRTARGNIITRDVEKICFLPQPEASSETDTEDVEANNQQPAQQSLGDTIKDA